MAEPPLIVPDHRLLGWGVTDLTLYGAQPLPGMAIGPARDLDAEALRSTALAGGEQPGAAPADARIAAPANDSGFDQGIVPAAKPAAVTPLSFLHAHDPSRSHAPEPLSVPQPTGSGSFVQPPFATPLQATEAGHDSPPASPAIAPEAPQMSSAPAPAVDAAIASAVEALATLAAAADPLSHATLSQPPLAVADVTSVAHDLTSAADPLTLGALSLPTLAAADLTPVTHDLTATVDATVHAIAAETPDLPSPAPAVTATAAETVDAVVHAAAPLPEATVAPVAEVAHAAGALPDAVAVPVAEVVHATALPDAMAAPVADTALAGLGGSDPAGGISTLVGMVDNVDAFHLDHALAPVAAATPAPSILDALAADDHAPALLGDAHGVDHPVDDHGGGIHVGF